MFDVRFEYLVYGKEPMFNLDDQRKRKLVRLFDELNEPCKDFMLAFLEYYQNQQEQK